MAITSLKYNQPQHPFGSLLFNPLLTLPTSPLSSYASKITMASHPPPTANLSDLLLRALGTTEIALLIRKDLHGRTLKNCVLVCKTWWRLFAPFLWENIYIDYNPHYFEMDHYQEDNKVVFRNGLAARSLTLSIYHPTDIDGALADVANRCRNIERLHLKLFSSDLTTNMCPAQKSTQQQDLCLEPANVGKDVPVLDMLLSKLPNVSDLTISLADYDLAPQIVWCATQLSSQLLSLSLRGGLRCPTYFMNKNSLCDWAVIMDVVRELPRLDSLSVHWKNTISIPDESPRITSRSQTDGLQNFSLKRLEIMYAQFGDETLLDAVFKACPNIHSVRLSSTKASTPSIIDNAINRLLSSCKSLKSLQYNGSDSTHCSNEIFRENSDAWTFLSQLTLSSVTMTAANLQLLGKNAPATLYKLDLSSIECVEKFSTILESFNNLSSLRLAGTLAKEFQYGHEYEKEARYFFFAKIPLFASGDTLEHLDFSELIIQSFVIHERVFDRIQQLPRLTHLDVNFNHLVMADLEVTWPYLGDAEEVNAGASLPVLYGAVCPDQPYYMRFPYPFWTQPHTKIAKEKQYRERKIGKFVQEIRRGTRYGTKSEDDTASEDDSENEASGGYSPHLVYDSDYELNVQPLDGDAKTNTNVFSSCSFSVKDQAKKTNFFERKFRLFSNLTNLHVHNVSITKFNNYFIQYEFLSLHMLHAITGMAPKLERLSYQEDLRLHLNRARRAYRHIEFYPTGRDW
ncbi:hypothetical protein BGW38_002239 [Lunasporangiospora selenospora]|uniref:F-box domain-containing protein n=1 Tax=Lunasporangiospora selenospora TaxID=979761 RepID=A0A9P6FSC2_9FUNG|nr:hypothetical protein BGW38_002239 [Lunasporangiospora selenospora]